MQVRHRDGVSRLSRLNALSYWLFLFGGLIVVSGFLTPGGAADFGWYAYAPPSGPTFAPGTGCDLWFAGLIVTGLARSSARST